MRTSSAASCASASLRHPDNELSGLPEGDQGQSTVMRTSLAASCASASLRHPDNELSGLPEGDKGQSTGMRISSAASCASASLRHPDNKLSGLPEFGMPFPVLEQTRINELGTRHFVTFGTYKRRRFLDPDRTKDIVVEVLQKCMDTHKTNCAGFVVMPDHVHAIVFGEEDFDISQFIQVWKKTSSYRIKKFYALELSHYLGACPGDGPIWQAGFHDYNADSDKKHDEKLGYMHNNPVEAKLVDYHISWHWSSARFYELNEAVGVAITP